MPITDENILKAIQVICDRLAERAVSLFLGAGVNFGLVNGDGTRFPLGNDLSMAICRNLLGAPDLKLTLDETAEMARFRVGNSELNRYLFDLFNSFSPGPAHKTIVRLPWDAIYTTNYDLLIENAAGGSAEEGVTIRPIFSLHTNLDQFVESDVLYYKLHGSIDFANTEEGRLILTNEDYRYYERFRKPLFQRLSRDIIGRTLVFIGYSLGDPNFRQVLEDARDELGARTLPHSYAVRPGFESVEAAFWKSKYNIELLDIGGEEFLTALQETWEVEERSIIPFEVRRSRHYVELDRGARFERVGNSFLRVSPPACTGPSDPSAFFRGAEPTWGDIRDHIAPNRDAYWTVLDGLFPELVDPKSPPSLFLITGAAGNGKTTLLYTIGFDVARDFETPVLLHIPGTPLDIHAIELLVSEDNPQRMVLLVRHAADYVTGLEAFLEEAQMRRLPISILLEERLNQWSVATDLARRRLNPAVFELGRVSLQEINDILDALDRHGELGKLTGADRDVQVDHFEALADNELIVALRELTSEDSFDAIIRDEYLHIPSEIAQRAYVYVAALGQFDLALRYETLTHILDVRYDQLGPEVFRPTQGVLISGEEIGSSRHNAGFTLRARHPIIASVIFGLTASDDDARFAVFNSILQHLDPGFAEDRRLLGQMVLRKELVNTFASPAHRRALFERLEQLMPGEAFVLQHRSILERDLGDADQAVRYAQAAVALQPHNLAVQNTLGFALEFSARKATDELRRQALLAEASRIFDRGIQKDPGDAYSYLGRMHVLEQQIQLEKNPDQANALKAEFIALLEEAYEATSKSPLIADQLAGYRARVGEAEKAIEVLNDALQKKPDDSRIRDILIRLETERGDISRARRLASEGIKLDPTSWRLQRHLARILRKLGQPVKAVRGHYESACRHRRGDVRLAVELGAYLFMMDNVADAKEVFNKAKGLQVSSTEKVRIRDWWCDAAGSKVVFIGKVKEIHGAKAWALAIPQGFEAFFWRTSPDVRDLQIGDQIKFVVGFNAYGLVARIVAKV